MNVPKIPKRVSMAIINSLTAGVVPRIGLEHIAVGRKREIEAILRDLNNISEGAAVFRFIVGRYGSGKSFMLQIIRNYAMDRGFVVADVDLSPEKRLTGTNRQGLSTYRELLERLSTRLRPDGGALEAILQKWINSIQTKLISENGINPEASGFCGAVENKIYETLGSMENFVHGFDFANAIAAYWKGYSTHNDAKKQAAIRWLRGEFATKNEARAELPVGEIITDDNWYDYIKLLAVFVTEIGYCGLILFIDECVNLYKISNRISRENNYEKLLAMFNDTMQGKARNIGILAGATPQFVEDERRGLYSYEALKSRLVSNSKFIEGYADMTGPILRLEKLTAEEILVLLERLLVIHAAYFEYTPLLTTEQLINFIQYSMNRIGADELLTTREITRDFLCLLNILFQEPTANFDELVKNEKIFSKNGENSEKAENNKFAEFEL